MFEYKTIRDTEELLAGNRKFGLSVQEAARRLSQNGTNQLKEPKKKSIIAAFFEQLSDPLIYVLLAAAAVSVFLNEISDAVIILIVVLMNAVVGMIQEGKAARALESLKKLTTPHAYVMRGGSKMEVSAASLVVGDVVCLEPGCQVSADLRLLTAVNLKIEESALTGESVAQEKDADFLPKSIVSSESRLRRATASCEEHSGSLPLGDRKNMAYMTTIVTGGRGTGMVTAVGMDTEIGKIAALINETPTELTPLQRRLGELGKWLSFLSLGLCMLLFAIAVIQKRDILQMLITAISLAVAAVPEGLPAVVTICLALSVTRMVKVHTIVRRLPSVETLGAVSVVCSDKTGTLTQNKMTVTRFFSGDDVRETGHSSAEYRDMNRGIGRSVAEYRDMSREISGLSPDRNSELLKGFVLCNDGILTAGTRIGDPTELALLELAAGFDICREELERSFPRYKEIAFDSERKMMSTYHRGSREAVTYTKGAPDMVIKKCTSILISGKTIPMSSRYRRLVEMAQADMAAGALRTLALARREGGSGPVEEQLTFIGMVGMQDPPRPEAAEAVAKFRTAGVSTVMITGDHVDTAFAIASQLGIVKSRAACMTGEELAGISREALNRRLDTVRVFARVSPEHKVRIVKSFKEKGKVVAMTGDGINDAPSLKAADVGIAMGMSGTDVAKQASHIILTDDNFATIEKAMEEGRGVYENIRKSVIFLLSSNLGEIMTMFTAVLLGLASPLQSSHILWINLITDSLPALALGVDKNDGNAMMHRPPRKATESLFAGGGLACTCFYGILIAAISLTAFLMVPLEALREAGISGVLHDGTLSGIKLSGVLHDGMLSGIKMSGRLSEIFQSGGLRMLTQQLSDMLGRPEILMRAQTYAFTVLGMSQLFHAVGMRNIRRSVFFVNHLENKLMIVACIFGFLLQLAVTKLPFLIAAFGTVHLDAAEWMRLVFLASFPMIAHELMAIMYHFRNRKG